MPKYKEMKWKELQGKYISSVVISRLTTGADHCGKPANSVRLSCTSAEIIAREESKCSLQPSGSCPRCERLAGQTAAGKMAGFPRESADIRVIVNVYGRSCLAGDRDTRRISFSGAKPSHMELLDWLAAEFMERGWSMSGTKGS